jgi:pimeloyl-ACP methyl ester carboxylesterase
MGRRWRALQACCVAGMLLWPAVRTGATRATASVQDSGVRAGGSGCASRLVVLLAGYNTRSADVSGTFSDIKRQVLSHIHYARAPMYFSYRYPAPYDAHATYDALPDRGVTALRRTIAGLLRVYPTACIDLIGHSLGGAVAFRYASRYALSSADGRHLAHVVSLDGPVNGTSYQRLSFVANWMALAQLGGSPTGTFLRNEHATSHISTLNARIVRQLAAQVVVKTLASTDDLLVPAADAEIPGYSLQYHFGRDLGACQSVIFGRRVSELARCLGHDQILRRSQALRDLRAVLDLPAPHAPVTLTPTPSPTRRPTATARPLSTARSTVTATILATATPTSIAMPSSTITATMTISPTVTGTTPYGAVSLPRSLRHASAHGSRERAAPAMLGQLLIGEEISHGLSPLRIVPAADR